MNCDDLRTMLADKGADPKTVKVAVLKLIDMVEKLQAQCTCYRNPMTHNPDCPAFVK